MSLFAAVTAAVLGVGASAVALPVAPRVPTVLAGSDGSVTRPSTDCTIVGTPGDDVLRGTPGDDVICGLAGDDVIVGGRGNDVLRGGRGNDRLVGGAGNDVLRSGASNPAVARGTGGDVLRGGRGADRLRGENGADRLYGGAGPDQLWGGKGADRVVGGPGSDRLHGGPGSDRLDARDRTAHRLIAGRPASTGAGFVDQVSCGAGAGDVARADPQDHVSATCERYPDNRPPTDLRLSGASIRENRPVGTTVGTLSAVDPNVGDRVTFTLVPGAGRQDNGAFRIVGRRLVTHTVFDFETKHSYSVRIRATDQRGAGRVQAFTIAVSDEAENQAPVARDGSRSTAEDSSVPLDLAALASDAETSDADLTYAIMGAPAHGTVQGTGTATTYIPDPDFNGTDTLRYRVTDRGNPDGCAPGAGCGPARSATGTITITVDPVNDAPVAEDGTRTTDEDTPLALDLGALVSDLETSDANLTYEIRSLPAHGTLNAAGTTYTPDPGFNGTDSLTYQVVDRGDPDACSGGLPTCDAPETSTTRTVSITVNPVNHAPAAPDATRTTDEDTPLAIDLAALASDPETATADLTITVTSPSHGTLTGSGGPRTYTPDPDFSGTDTFSYTVTDRGDPDDCTPGPGCAAPRSTTGTVTITVGAVNDAPVNSLPAGPISTLPNTDTPITGLSVADVDAGTDPVELTLAVDDGTLSLNTTHLDPAEIVGNGTATVVVTASVARINATLAEPDGVVFRGSTNDTLTMTTDDLGHNGAGGARTDTDTLAIDVNRAPVATGQSVTATEDTPQAITLSATDADGNPLTFAIATSPAHSTLVTVGPATCTGATPNVCTANLTYIPAADYNGPDGFTFIADDGVTTSAPATVSITVMPVNDAPRLQNIEGTPVLYTENDSATGITSTLTLTDPDTTIAGATVMISANFAQTEDMLGFTNQSGISGSYNTATGVLTLTGDATPATYQAALRSVTYDNLSQNPSMATRTVTFQVRDAQGALSGPATRDIVVTAVNDAPVLTVPGGQTVAEDTDLLLGTAGANALSVADPDAGSNPIKVSLDVVHGTLTLASTAGLTLVDGTANGTGSVHLTGTLASINTALANGLTYRGTANYNSTRGAESLIVLASDQGNTGAGGPLTDSDTVAISVTAVNDPPVAVPHIFTAQANMKVTDLGSLLTGATDPDAGDGGFTSTLVVGTDISATTPAGGVVTTLNQNTGSFDFDPPAGATGPVTFTYTVCDNGNPSPPSLCSAPATVTINVAGPMIWFVNSAAATNGDGRLDRPFNNLAAANAVDAANQGVFLYSSATPYSGALALNPAEKLVGQATTGSTFDGVFGISPPAGTMARPTLGGGTATMTGTLTLANSVTVRGLALSTGASDALVGAGGLTSVDVAQTSLTTTTGTALNLNNVGGTVSLSDLDKNGAGTGIALTNVPANVTVGPGATIAATTAAAVDIDLGTGAFSYAGTITNSAGRAVDVTNRNTGSPGPVQFTGSVTSTGGTGINLDNNDNGTVGFSGGLTLSTGASPAYTATNGGTVTVTGPGNTLTTTTGTALTVADTTIGAGGLTFQSISANGAANGIRLDTTGSSGALVVTGNGGTCTNADTSGCTGGQIQNTTGADDSTAAPVGTGIVLKDTSAPSLTRMWIHDNSNYAIRGSDVAGFSFANSVINGTNGTNGTDPFNDSSAYFNNLTGSAAVTNSDIRGGFENNFAVINSSGSLDRITFSADTFGDNNATNGNDAVQLESLASASALKATVQNSTFIAAEGDLIDYSHEGGGPGDLVLTNNAFSNSHPGIATGGGGLTLSNSGTSGNTTMSITNNTFRDAVGPGVLIVKTTGPSTQTGTFSGNTIGVSGVANSGSAEGSALKLQTVGQGTLTWSVTNNQIYGYNNNGIEVVAGGGATSQGGAVNTTITGNTIAQPGTTPGTISIPKQGVHLNIGTVPGDTYATCAAISGNTISASGADGVPATGVNVDVRLRQRQSTTIRLPGYTGGPTDTAAVQSFVTGNNDAGSTALAQASSPPGGGFTGNGTTCP